MTVAAPCITNIGILLAKSIACSFMALTATKEQLLFGKGGLSQPIVARRGSPGDFANSVPPFVIPLVLDIERGKGKRDLDGAGMAPCHPDIAVTSTDNQRLHVLTGNRRASTRCDWSIPHPLARVKEMYPRYVVPIAAFR